MPLPRPRLRRHYALPAEHGTWAWWIGPLLVGAAAGGRPTPALLLLALAALLAFLLHQPAAIAVKALVGRRPRADLSPALAWAGLYAAGLLLACGALVAAGHARVLLLGLPGAAVSAVHLAQVSRRRERRRRGLQVLAAAAMALTAPAAYLVGGGCAGGEARCAWAGAWGPWALTWLHSVAATATVHLRFAQKTASAATPIRRPLSPALRALGAHGAGLAAATGGALACLTPPLAPIAFALALADGLDVARRPRPALRPVQVGLRQLVVTTLVTAVLVLAWSVGLPHRTG